MTKPKILILMHYMELGGAEMALLGLLDSFDPDKVDVDLFIYSHQGPLMPYIPKWVNLLPEKKTYSLIEKPLKIALIKYPLVAIGRLMAKSQHRRYRKKYPIRGRDDGSIYQFVAKNIRFCLPRINPDIEYDLCVSFLTPHDYGIQKVRAKKRLAWIHTDYSTVSVNSDLELPVWGAYDNIASISEDVTKSFLKTFPSLKSKIIQIENMLPASYIKSRSDEFDANSEMRGVTILSIGRYVYQKNFDNIAEIMKAIIRLLSIGRFCTAKNYDNEPDIACRIINEGVENLKWYIIGYGPDEALIRRKIQEAGMEDHVILLGRKENPYPYIKACDIYVQPSRYEGKSVTVREAQMLGKPVVVTNYPTASSQINDGVDGVIVPLDNERCSRGIAEFILNTKLQTKIIENLRHSDFSLKSEVQKIYQLLEE